MDQDDSMLSSPSSNDDTFEDDDNLFPESSTTESAHTNTTNNARRSPFARPQTPQNDHLNAAAPGELSPPRSQNVPSTAANIGRRASGTVDVGGRRGIDVSGGAGGIMGDVSSGVVSGKALNQSSMTGVGGSGEEEQWKPGSGWKSKKAQEDMQRAWDNLVDRDFDLQDYGDVMAHRMNRSG